MAIQTYDLRQLKAIVRKELSTPSRRATEEEVTSTVVKIVRLIEDAVESRSLAEHALRRDPETGALESV